VYSSIENVRSVAEIQHPAVRAILTWAEVEDGLEIHHDGDLPARSGLGSSSSFTVGLLHALSALRGRYASKDDLARNAIHIEQDVIKESVGSQDQVSAAYGGFNRIEFNRNDTFSVSPVLVPPERMKELQDHLMLCFTGFSRIASEVAQSKIKNMKNRENELLRMQEMVREAIELLQNPRVAIEEFGKLLDQHWRYKRSLSEAVSNADIDGIYEAARSAGAGGGKLLGAGGGGFMLLFAKPGQQEAVRSRLNRLIHVPFKFEDSGSRVVLYQPSGL